MILFPAVDIKNGNVVRLMQGKFDQIKTYSQDPLSVAQEWEKKGAQWLHLIDLDGAQTGQMKNLDVINKIARTLKIPVQVGGGVRKKSDIATLMDNGIARVILGTRAVDNLTFLKEVLAQWKDKIAVSLDCSNGMVAERGWTTTSNIKATDLAKTLEKLGLQCLIYTDIARDGMLTGPNIEGLEEILDITNIPIIASGGVSNLEDVKRLRTLVPKGLIGAITGKAIYEGKLHFEEAIKLCSRNE